MRTTILLLLLASPLLAQQRGTNWKAAGSHGAVAAGGQGAVDAAAATILALSVTDSGAFCFGGEVPILVYDAKRNVVEVLVGLGAAPGLATREHFTQKGGIPGSGIEAAAVPRAFDAVLTALDRYASKTSAEVDGPMLAMIDKGSKGWHSHLASTVRRKISAEKEAHGDRRRGLRLAA